MANPTKSQLFYPTRNKLWVLQALAEHFVLRSRDLAAILRGREPNKNDIRTINRTLKILDEAGLVYRLKYLELTTDGVAYACGLTDAGVCFCGGGKTFDEHSRRTIDHELAISDFHRSVAILPITWKQDNLKHGVNPDAYFALTGTEKTHHFFLEMERVKIGNYKDGEPSIIRKLNHYYDYYNTPKCEQHWGFKTYRVTVVVRNEERRENLLKVMQDGLRHRMFWIGTEGGTYFLTPNGDTFSFNDLN